MTEAETLSVIIKKHRKIAGLTQIGLAELAGVGKTVVFDLEKGKETVQLNTLLKILKVLNIRIKFESPFMDKILNNDENS
jgi:HTH-type transcriptional regulator / antitoxin HipB